MKLQKGASTRLDDCVRAVHDDGGEKWFSCIFPVNEMERANSGLNTVKYLTVERTQNPMPYGDVSLWDSDFCGDSRHLLSGS